MPNRIIKESICTSENLNKLDTEAEIFFYRLIVACDDYGIFYANPSILRAKCFPLKIDKIKDKDIEKWIVALIEAGLIFTYEYEGRLYLKMTKWEHHQQVRASKSKFPTPDLDGVKLISIDINGNQEQTNVPVIVFENRNRIRESGKKEFAKYVHMTEEEYQKLCNEFGQAFTDEKIEDLNNWKGGKGKATKDDYLTIRAWIRKDKKNASQQPKKTNNGPLGVVCATKPEDLVRRDWM